MSKKKKLRMLEDQIDVLIERVDRVNEILGGHEVSLHDLHNQFLPSEKNAGNTIADQMIKLNSFVAVVKGYVRFFPSLAATPAPEKTD